MRDMVFDCLCQGGNGYNKLTEMNQIEFQMFFLFLSIATHRFKWDGLPKELPNWCLEKVVNLYGQGVVVKVGEQYACTSAVNSALLDLYGEPCEVQAVALNGVNLGRYYVKDTMIQNQDSIQKVNKNAVLVKNNLYSIPTYALIKPFIKKLCFIWESAGINAGLSRIVALIHCNKDVAGTIKNELGKILGGTKSGIAVINERNNVLEKLDKLDLKVEYTPDKYWLDFDNTFNKICELIGITCDMNKSKKERVLVSQVESNDELTTIVEDTFLEYRKLACDEMKELWCLDVSVENKEEQVKTTNPNDVTDRQTLDTQENTPMAE